MLQKYESRHVPLVQKYEQRGWRLGNGPKPHGICSGTRFRFDTGLHQDKLLADASTWKIAFNTDTVSTPAPPAWDLECTHISLDIRDEEGQDSHYYIIPPRSFVSIVLQKEYFYGTWAWAHWLARKLYPRVKQELAQLDEASRPSFYEEVMFRSQENMNHHATEWTPSLPSWRFYDEMIPEWFEDYKESEYRRN